LALNHTELSGEIPEEICNLINLTSFTFLQNELCPPYPDCGEGEITSENEQDTSDCPDE